MKSRDKKEGRRSEEEQGGKEPFENQPLPGEYPPAEDIMNRKNTERVSIDPDSISRRPSGKIEEVREKETDEPAEFPAATTPERSPSESDLTREDYEALGPVDLSMDGGDDEQLKQRTWPVDFAASDLDVPNGEEDRNDKPGQVDEENDHYSLGGDEKDSLEDDPTRTFG